MRDGQKTKDIETPKPIQSLDGKEIPGDGRFTKESHRTKSKISEGIG